MWTELSSSDVAGPGHTNRRSVSAGGILLLKSFWHCVLWIFGAAYPLCRGLGWFRVYGNESDLVQYCPGCILSSLCMRILAQNLTREHICQDILRSGIRQGRIMRIWPVWMLSILKYSEIK